MVGRNSGLFFVRKREQKYTMIVISPHMDMSIYGILGLEEGGVTMKEFANFG